ncbi:MAG TPA: phosphonopyruvate decarboxylase, partial [Clostridiales bacterium]|nr:phosphonopyruvate decarboxylase [Clostridiales bacterium]
MDLNFLKQYDFFTGVPDSLLSPVCSYLISNYGISKQHIIAANEGNAVALAAGYHLSTGKVPVVYLQNSGIGNIINPVASLMNDKVYGIPCIFLIGWRGEPGVHDEPQHIFQGEVTMKLLEDMDIKTYVISKETSDEEFNNVMKLFQPLLDAGKQIAFVVKKDALHFDCKVKYQNQNTMTREEIIKRIVNASEDDIIISTTGKTSRELFEIRV